MMEIVDMFTREMLLDFLDIQIEDAKATNSWGARIYLENVREIVEGIPDSLLTMILAKRRDRILSETESPRIEPVTFKGIPTLERR